MQQPAHPDYRAVPAAINALGAHQRDRVAAMNELRAGLADLRHEVRAGSRSTDEQLAEIRELIVNGMSGG